MFTFMDIVLRVVKGSPSVMIGFVRVPVIVYQREIRVPVYWSANLVQASRLSGVLSSTNVSRAGDMVFINCSRINKSSSFQYECLKGW